MWSEDDRKKSRWKKPKKIPGRAYRKKGSGITDTPGVINWAKIKLIRNGWDKVMRMFLVSYDMIDMVDQIHQIRRDVTANYMNTPGKKEQYAPIPTLNKALKWLVMCPHWKMKAVIVIDCYTSYNDLMNGLPMTDRVRQMSKYQAKRVYDSMTRATVYNGQNTPQEWIKQGVLMIPASTSLKLGRRTVDKTPVHQIMGKFKKYLIEKINIDYPEIPVIYIGPNSLYYKPMFKSPNQRILDNGKHDAARITDDTVWQWCNDLIKLTGKRPVRW